MMRKSSIRVDANLPVSKYRQIVNSVLESIQGGMLRLGDKMPSINSLCQQHNLSRDTVLSAYAELKARGIISSMPGKGYYVASVEIRQLSKIFLLFDELNSFKEDLYNAFLSELEGQISVEIYFHHFNRKLFDSLITANNGDFTHYVIMPAKFTNTRPLLESLNGRVIVLDQLPDDLRGCFPAIYQNFEKDTFEALMSGRERLKKYRKLIMVYPGGKEPEGQFRGFLNYCHETQTPFELLSDLKDRQISAGEAYIAIWDRDLVFLVKQAQQRGMEIGRDIGIISYNDTSLKQIVANGITTISTDFRAMGKSLARQAGLKNKLQLENPSSLIIRGSL